MRRRTFISASIGIMSLPQIMPAHSSGPKLYHGAALAFGTTISVSVVHEDQGLAELAIQDALRAAQRIDRLMSIFNPDSQVFQLNRDGCLVRPDPHLLVVLEQARQLSRSTGGAFDVTVQPLWRAFSAAPDGVPSEPERLHAQARVGWRQLEFDHSSVRFQRPGMALTLNGLAQGYAADLALAAVRARGIEHALLDTGEFIARGKPLARRAWTLGIQHPRKADALAATLRIDGRSVATSGDYETAFTPDYVHHHIFDPVSGDSPLELASVTVLAPSGLQADGWSTAFMVMGADKAHTITARLPGIDLMTIDKHGAVKTSSTFPTLPDQMLI